MIDLCIDARMAFSSGIGTCIRQLVPYFNQSPFRVILLVDRIGQEWCKDIEQIPFSAPIYSIQEQISFPSKIPHCDLFWSPHYNVPLLPIHAKKRIVTIHDACHLALKHFSFSEKAYARFLMSRALHSNLIITVSEFSKAEIIRFLGSPKNPFEIIHNGVDHKRFQRIESQLIRHKYNLPKQFLLFVGNVKPHKNLEGLLTAFSKLSPDWNLVVVGKNKNSPPKIDRVLYLDQVSDEDLPGLYSSAEIFILPSFYEGFGFPPLEAMSCGCPTIVSNSASLPEVCGDASLFINPHRPEEIRDRIMQLASDPELKDHIVQKGYQRVHRFHWADAAEKYRDLFKNCHLRRI